MDAHQAVKRHRIVYIQYTNPAGYPPLQHSSEILADSGWEVLFLGTTAIGTDALRFPPHERILFHQLQFQPAGWRQKAHYAWFHVWCCWWLIRWRPSWVYASDIFAAPLAWFTAAVLRIPTIFHEHDSPDSSEAGMFFRFCLWARRRCARRATLCILPNARRAEAFCAETGARMAPLVVWNCPSLREVRPARGLPDGSRLRLLYHGSLGPSLIPLSAVDMLALVPEAVSLTVVGYETIGTQGYSDELRRRAAEVGVSHRLTVMPPVSRQPLLDICSQHDVGLAMMPLETRDFNQQTLVGASNKVFDYMACGLALLVSNLPEWEHAYVRPGYGLACNPTSPESIAANVRRLLEDPAYRQAMGERGRQRILEDCNYEHRFRPVLDLISGLTSIQPAVYGSVATCLEESDR